jgi:hypothetical protein
MQNLFLTASDQIVDLNFVAAIEVVDAPVKYSAVHFHLSTGVTIVSPHTSHENAVAEKWDAYQRMTPNNRALHTEPRSGAV